MTKTLSLAGGLALALVIAAQPLAAQTRPAPKPAAAPAAAAAPRVQVAPGIAIADLDAAIENTNAFRAGMTQAQQLYKPAIDAAQAKFNEYNARLKTMVDQLNADAAAKKSDAVLQQQYTEIKKVQAQRDEEVATILRPYQLAEAYIREQIEAKLGQAVQNVAQRRGISLILRPNTVYVAAPAYDITGPVVQELNVLVPSVQVVPPAGWLPRELREQQAQQQGGAQPAPAPAAAQPARPGTTPPAPAPRPAGPQPEGR